MSPFRITQHLVFATDADRKALDDTLSEHLLTISEILRHEEGSINIYLSGSLARQEPSVVLHKEPSRTTLNSDIDLIVVTPFRCLARPRVRELEECLQATFPEFQDTVYAFHAEQVPRLHSASARDFCLGRSQPLAEEFELPTAGRFKLRSNYFVEVLVYQLIAWLTQATKVEDEKGSALTGMWSRANSYLSVKLIADAFRAASFFCEDQWSLAGTYKAVYTHRNSLYFAQIADNSFVEEILFHREQFSAGYSVSKDVLLDAVVRSLSACTNGAKPGLVLMEELQRLYYPTNHIIHLLPRIAVATLLSQYDGISRSEKLKIARRYGQDVGALPFDDALAWLGTTKWKYLAALIDAKDRGIDLITLGEGSPGDLMQRNG